MEEPTTDNRKTLDRNQYWVPNTAKHVNCMLEHSVIRVYKL